MSYKTRNEIIRQIWFVSIAESDLLTTFAKLYSSVTWVQVVNLLLRQGFGVQSGVWRSWSRSALAERGSSSRIAGRD